MKSCLLLRALLALWVGLPAVSSTLLAQSTCNTPEVRTRDYTFFKIWADMVASDPHPQWVESRTQLNIPSAGAAFPVTDATVCQKLVTAYNSAFGRPNGTVRHVFAFMIGQRYVVKDPTQFTGEYGFAIVTDNKFKLLKKFTS